MVGSFSVNLTSHKPSTDKLCTTMINRTPSPSSSDSSDTFSALLELWTPQDLDLIKKFQTRTVTTIGTGNSMKMYQREILGLATAHPFLMHCLMTLTMMHDRFLTGSFHTRQSAEEVSHWYRGTAMFKDALSQTARRPDEKDALWASAALLGAIQFSYIEASTPEMAWPMKPASSDDLDWLSMSDGKKAVWKIADPLRPDSAFKDLAKDHVNIFQPRHQSVPHVDAPYAEFAKIFELDADSTKDTNPYHDAACSLARLLHVECNATTVLEFLSFISHVQPELKKLIERKEPRALLLIACWYAKTYSYQWWIYRRGLLEGQSICMYLDKYHPYEEAIHRLLEYPKQLLGFETSNGRREAEVAGQSFTLGWMYFAKNDRPWLPRRTIATVEAV